MRKIVALLIMFLPSIIYAQDYNVALIPDSLKTNANAVKRFEELRVIIKSTSKAVIKHKYAITILNEAGNEFSQYTNSYDKLQSLSNIDGNLYDASGKKLKNVKKKDIADVSYDDDMSLVTDNRLKQHNFYYRSYPYTIEYEDEQELDGIFFLPQWQPQNDENYSVQLSRYIVQMPKGYEIRYKQFNYQFQPAIAKNDKENSYTWEVRNIKPIKYEYFQPALQEITTCVFIAPTDFEIQGYKGDMRTWQSLGKFIATLNNGRDQVPDNVKQDIHKLADGVKDKKEKIKMLYEYLQKNTRYIGIQLGIGSWQPFDAKYVSSKKYGDCKALSNYMVSLLKEAGIKANYVLINAGDGRKGLWEDFSAPYFNHAIMCVPDANDTLWLECTSQTASAGFMGSFTGNRKALLIAEDGGHIVSTPFYKSNDNLQLRKINAKIDEQGNLDAEVETFFTGIKQELQHSLMHDVSKEQREKYLNKILNLPTYRVDKIDYKEDKKIIPVINEHLHIISQNYANITGRRLFIKPNLFNKSNIKLPADEVRRFDIAYTYSFNDVDSILISIPAGYAIESVPKAVVLSNKFGNYSINFKVSDSIIEVVRTQTRDAARFPSADYAELVKFYDAMYKADRSQVVLVKKES